MELSQNLWLNMSCTKNSNVALKGMELLQNLWLNMSCTKNYCVAFKSDGVVTKFMAK